MLAHCAAQLCAAGLPVVRELPISPESLTPVTITFSLQRHSCIATTILGGREPVTAIPLTATVLIVGCIRPSLP